MSWAGHLVEGEEVVVLCGKYRGTVCTVHSVWRDGHLTVWVSGEETPRLLAPHEARRATELDKLAALRKELA